MAKEGKSKEDVLLQEDLITVMPMVYEASAISEELNKKVSLNLVATYCNILPLLKLNYSRGLSGLKNYPIEKLKCLEDLLKNSNSHCSIYIHVNDVYIESMTVVYFQWVGLDSSGSQN